VSGFKRGDRSRTVVIAAWRSVDGVVMAAENQILFRPPVAAKHCVHVGGAPGLQGRDHIE
jgi:hypothetical protein